MKKGKGRFSRIVTILLAGSVSGMGAEARAEADQRAEARAILESVRMNQRLQNRTFSGRLRTGKEVVPFTLVLEESTVRYCFESPTEELVVHLGDESARLEAVSDTRKSRIQGKRLRERVRNTDITYEDAALQFLYWDNAKVLGEELLLTRRCLKLELHPSQGEYSQYGTVWAWIEKTSGALMKAECYGRDGLLDTRFKVISGQMIDGEWILKRMRIERMEGDKPRDNTPTYLEIDRFSS